MSNPVTTEPTAAPECFYQTLTIRSVSVLSSGPSSDRRPRWRHVKRGTVYIVLGTGCLQTAEAMLDDQDVTIYRAETGGVTWVRPTYEFMDGRFERVVSA